MSSVALAGTECSSQGSSRSLVQTKEVILPQIDNWKIMAKNRSGLISCIATGKFTTIDLLTIIYEPGSSHRGGKWFFSVALQRKSPKNFDNAARLLVDGKRSDSGKFIVGSTGDYMRIEFPNIDENVQKLRDAKKIEIGAEAKGWKNIEVPLLNLVISGLDRCVVEANGPNKLEFWKNAEDHCS